MNYSITELSKIFNLPASTIRYYENRVVGKCRHINAYRRVYDDAHIDRLVAIECFKRLSSLR